MKSKHRRNGKGLGMWWNMFRSMRMVTTWNSILGEKHAIIKRAMPVEVKEALEPF